MNILLTGGTGYIGSHTCVVLLKAGYDVIVIDNLSNSSAESLRRVERITGKRISFHKGDLRDISFVEAVFSSGTIDAVVHFAGLKSVAESEGRPLEYYANNVGATMALLRVMEDHSVKKIVFSSSATVYGNPDSVPIKEDAPLRPVNPYGRTKLIIENMLRDLHESDNSWNISILRYFNPVGAHQSGLIGEDPVGIPNNLMPYISKVAVEELLELQVFGSDYPTPDGTGIRDYIHVMDLANGHIKALQKLETACGVMTCNLGTGRGYSVMEMISAFEKVCNRKIPYRIVGRRPGDVAACYADPSYAQKELEWAAVRDIENICADSWRWQSKYPNGYSAK